MIWTCSEAEWYPDDRIANGTRLKTLSDGFLIRFFGLATRETINYQVIAEEIADRLKLDKNSIPEMLANRLAFYLWWERQLLYYEIHSVGHNLFELKYPTFENLSHPNFYDTPI